MNKHLKKYLKQHTPEIQGIAWMIVACFWFSVMASLIRYISESLPTFEIVFFRNLFALITMLPWLMRNGIGNLKSKKWHLYGYRTISGTIGMCSFFYALSIMPLTDVIALTFTVPLITTLFAMIFLGERFGLHRWGALLVGFLGVLIILRPGVGTFEYVSLFVLLTACCWSASNIFVKKLTDSESPYNIVFMMNLIMTPVAFPLLLLVWQVPTLEQLLLLCILGFTSNQAQFAITHAYSNTDLNVIMPFDFSRMVFITIMAYLFFGEILSIWTAIGVLIIFISSLYVARRESLQKLL